MLGRLATYVIPVSAVLVTAAIIFGPGRARPVVGARVRGAPLDGTHLLALRIEGVRRVYGIDDAAVLSDIEVRADGTATRGSTGPDGICEVRLASATGWLGGADLRITASDGSLLASGRIALDRYHVPEPTSAFVQGAAQGDVVVNVEAVRGAFAAPFADPMRIHARAGGVEAGIAIDVEATGAEVTPPSAQTGPDGVASFALRPLHHEVELTVSARDVRGRTGSWTGSVPIAPGAIWLRPANAARGSGSVVTLVSPAPRDRAYLSILGADGRVFGASVPLASDGAGFFMGEAAIEAPAEGALYAVVAGDPFEQGAGTVVWPLRPAEGIASVRPKLELLLDGMPLAERLEEERAWRARRLGLWIIAAAAAIEIMLLVTRGRRAAQELEQQLSRAATGGAGEDLSDEERGVILAAARGRSPTLRIAIAAALIALGFGLVAALASYR